MYAKGNTVHCDFTMQNFNLVKLCEVGEFLIEIKIVRNIIFRFL